MHRHIRDLAKKRKAVILAHNYQAPEIQDAADLCGDSLELSRKAAQTDAEIIVFCGVYFMAETASILSQDKTVLIPVPAAGCPMADMITPEALRLRQEELPGVPTVTYVNSTAAVKALTDVCCTSANAAAVVNSLDADEVLMVPDRNLALYTAAHTKKKIHYWDGYCPTHDRLTAEHVKKAMAAHPEALFMAHPECRPEVLELAHAVRSTSGMLKFPEGRAEKGYIVGTETGLLYPLKKLHPNCTFYPAWDKMVCPNMKKTRLEDLLRCLETLDGEVCVPPETAEPARRALERMLAIV
ncbi:MAG: quinolinate synthase NadA [Deltaproteobacteria bacterium]|nr:quinolinate synthase NadA [Deltaproteobacteria bacterium]